MAKSDAPQVPMRDVGPDYKPKEEKPTATVSTDISYENVHILPQTPQLIALMTCVVYLESFVKLPGSRPGMLSRVYIR